MSASADPSAFIRSLDPSGPLRARVLAAAKRALKQFAQHVTGEAQQLAPQSPSNQYIPGKRKPQILNPRWTGHSGFLRDSAFVREVEWDGTRLSVLIGFGAEYAVYVHEDLTAHHTNGQAKFLETAVRNNQHKLAEFVMAAIRRELGNG